jgi:hypothetical protein
MIGTHGGRVALLGMAGCLVAATPARAQIFASERATLTQHIAGTTITIDYSRPSVRGRDSVFGKEVEWDEVWTPGANDATTLSTTRAMQLNGTEIQAGTYSVWMQARPDSAWMLYLHPDTTLFHIPHPSLDGMVYRIPVVRHLTSDLCETLSWDFQRIRATGAELQFRWADVVVPVAVKVEPGIETHVAAEVGLPYEGRWILVPDAADSTSSEGDGSPEAMQVRYDRGTSHLRGVFEGSGEIGGWEFLLIPRAEGIFLLGFLMDGELAELSFDYFLEFTSEDGRPVSFVGRDKDDAVFWRGVRDGSATR